MSGKNIDYPARSATLTENKILTLFYSRYPQGSLDDQRWISLCL